jgi:hypothetical protein
MPVGPQPVMRTFLGGMGKNKAEVGSKVVQMLEILMLHYREYHWQIGCKPLACCNRRQGK